VVVADLAARDEVPLAERAEVETELVDELDQSIIGHQAAGLPHQPVDVGPLLVCDGVGRLAEQLLRPELTLVRAQLGLFRNRWRSQPGQDLLDARAAAPAVAIATVECHSTLSFVTGSRLVCMAC
jgi:hypothetical protein